MDLWCLDGVGKLSGWSTDDRLNLEASQNDPVLLKLRVLIDQQKGVDNHMYGITTTGWRDFLEDSLLLSPDVAMKFQVALHKETQVGIHNMWLARNAGRHALISPAETWEIRTFEDAIAIWKKDLERRDRIPVEGSEARIRSWSRSKRLTWVHNILNKQRGITEFMFPIQSTTMAVSAEGVREEGNTVAVGSGLGSGTGLGSESGSERVHPTGGPIRRVQVRREQTQSKMKAFYKRVSDPVREMDSPVGVSGVIASQIEQPRRDSNRTETKKRTQIATGSRDAIEYLDQHIEDDQACTKEGRADMSHVGRAPMLQGQSDCTGYKRKLESHADQSRNVANTRAIKNAESTSQIYNNLAQANPTRVLTDKERRRMEGQKQLALGRIAENKRNGEAINGANAAKRAKPYHTAMAKACEGKTHRKRKREEFSSLLRFGDGEKERKREELSLALCRGEGGKKRGREENSIMILTGDSKRKKTNGQTGSEELGCSTHKGIS